MILEGGTPWGFRLQGGREFEEPITIAKVGSIEVFFVRIQVLLLI